MSNDTPTDPEPSDRELLLQVLERMGRVETALGIGDTDTKPLSGRVNRLMAEIAEFKSETRDALADVDRELARLGKQDAGRYLRLEDRVSRLEHPPTEAP